MDRLKAFPQVRLYRVWVFGLREDRNQLVVGQEVKNTIHISILRIECALTALRPRHRDCMYRLKAFPQMRLYRVRVFGLREDRNQLVVGQEVEAGEGGALGLEIVGQVLLDTL